MPKLKDYGFVFPFGKHITFQTNKKYLTIRKDKGRVQNTKTENYPLFEDRHLKKNILVLLSALVERFGVSHLRDFLLSCSIYLVYHLIYTYLLYFYRTAFSPTRPSGPSWSSSRNVRPSVCVLMSPSHAIFFCVVGLEQSVPCLWTGAISISILISSRALKTRMCSRVLSQSRS